MKRKSVVVEGKTRAKLYLVKDSRNLLQTLNETSVHCIVTDPPYGLRFMGKKWDYDVPSTRLWEEALRALKPGGYLLSFGGTRTYHRMVCNIEDAGFEIRDQIGWVYGSGFPKSLDVAKSLKRKGAVSPKLLDRWKGWGTALKPAWEPIVVARKPFAGAVAQNVLRNGVGALNIDGCRVPHNEKCRMMKPSAANLVKVSDKHRQAGRRKAVQELKPNGRWPTNLIHDGHSSVVSLFPCTKAGVASSPSRFFYCAKPSKAEKTVGDEMNTHPTIKPVDLMRYLVRLVCPMNGIVLDPFMGSGTTGVAAMLEGFRFIGSDREPEYVKLSHKRLQHSLGIL